MDIGLVCDACHGFSAMSDRTCSRCGVSLSLDHDESKLDDTQAPAATRPPAGSPGSTTQKCGGCQALLEEGMRFCSQCGSQVGETAAKAQAAAPATPAPRKTAFFGAMQLARAKLVLIRGDGMDGVSYTLAGQEHVAGRIEGPLVFEDDPYLSPRHANFIYQDGQLRVRDENSANGIFVRLRGSNELESGGSVLVGEQLLEVELSPIEGDPDPDEEGTYFFGSPRRPSQLLVYQRLKGGDTGIVFRSEGDEVTVGREGNDMDFPEDPFISGSHAKINYSAGKIVVSDLGSKNGTFRRIQDEEPLSHGDYVFMGQQLLRVEIV